MRYLPTLVLCVSSLIGADFHQVLNLLPTQGTSTTALQRMRALTLQLKREGTNIPPACHRHGVRLVSEVVQTSNTRDLIIVAGQSNAVGFDADPSEYRADQVDEKVMFWWRCGDPPPDDADSASRQWETLQPQPRGTPKPIDWPSRQYGNFRFEKGGFGPEIGMARQLMQKQKRSLAIVKVAFSGTALATDWNPTGSGEDGACYRALVQEVKKAMSEVPGDRLNLRAFVWVQGESDSGPQRAAAYEQNLDRMLKALKTDLNVPEFKALFAVNTRFNGGKAVRAVVDAQKALAERLDWAEYVDTSAAAIANGQHFNASGTKDIGRLFADTLLKMETE